MDQKKKLTSEEEDKKFPLPIYKKEEDIYSQEEEEYFDEDQPGKILLDSVDKDLDDDLDIPGAEIDDSGEDIEKEEENN